MMNHHFPSVDQKERIFGVIFLFSQILTVPFIASIIILLFDVVQTSVQNFICFALNFIFAVALFPCFWKRAVKDLTQKPFSVLRTAATYLGINYFCTILVNILIFNLDPEFSNANDSAIAAMSAESKLLITIGVVLFVPPAEELLFRGIVFGRLYPKHPILAYFLSTLVFSAIHVVGYIGSVPSDRLMLNVLQYVPISICLARAYVESKNIFAPILIHMIINFIAVLYM